MSPLLALPQVPFLRRQTIPHGKTSLLQAQGLNALKLILIRQLFRPCIRTT